jgi:hypothetical protein
MNGMQLALAMMKDSDLTEQQLEYASIKSVFIFADSSKATIMRCSAAFRSVRSRVTLTNPMYEP